jgi:hypothetical protein
MKKCALLFVVIISSSVFLHANPLPVISVARISELVFNDANQWTMELYFYTVGYDPNEIDSIVIESSSGRAKLNVHPGQHEAFILITSDSLDVPLAINRTGDRILVSSYERAYAYNEQDSLIFGSYVGATVESPAAGYSIMRFRWNYSYNDIIVDCLTQNPSPGEYNDPVPEQALLRGVLYDADNHPVKKLATMNGNALYFVMQSLMVLDTNGNYSTNIYPVTYNTASLTVRLLWFMGPKYSQPIEPMHIDSITPGDTITKDIHLTTNEYVDITSVKEQKPESAGDITLANYPNPFNSSTNFFVKLPASLQYKEGAITIYTINGQVIRTLMLRGNSTLQWDGTDSRGIVMSTGTYYYHLVVDGSVAKHGSMVLLK